MLPPTISTTPNSPSVWANARMPAVRMPGHASGASTWTNRRHGVIPQQAAASRTSAGTDLEGALDRLHHERHVRNRRRGDEPGEREREGLPGDLLEGGAER
jgi:hypothetical protein